MFVFHPLSEPTRRALIDGGLDPDDVAGIVRNAVTEDLMGGVDVTSVATIPTDHRSTATFGARQDGVVAGLPSQRGARIDATLAVAALTATMGCAVSGAAGAVGVLAALAITAPVVGRLAVAND